MRFIYNQSTSRLQKNFDDKTPVTVSELFKSERTASVPIELFLTDNHGGYATPGTTDFEVLIGRQAQAITTGKLTLTFTGTTEEIDLSKPKLATRIESALNAVSEVNAVGGVDVVELKSGRAFQITFRSVGSRSAITAGVKDSMQPASVVISEVTAGTESTCEVQLLTLEEASLAEVSTSDWTTNSNPSLSISTLVEGTANTREVVQFSVTGDPAPGSFFVVSNSEPIPTEATAAQVKTILNSAISNDIESVVKTGQRIWQITYKTDGDKPAFVAGTHNLIKRPSINATLNLNTTALAYAANSMSFDLSLGLTIKKSNQVLLSESFILSEPFAEILGSSAMLNNDSIGPLFSIDSQNITKGKNISLSGLSYDGTTLATPSALPLSGGTMTGDIEMNNNRLTGLADATQSSDAVTKGQLDALIDGAPDTLNTLNEIAASINDNPGYASSQLSQISSKLSKDGSESMSELQLDTALRLGQTTTPPTASGYGKIFTKTDNKLYFLQSDGTEREITLGPSTITYQVTVQSVDGSNKYFIDGTQQETLSLTEGNTYIFDWSTATGHPLKFSETSDGTHGGGTEYTTGVTVDESNYKTTIVVSANAPNLFYYCSNHSGMGGTANTPNASGSLDNEGESGSSGEGESGSSGGGGTPTTETFVMAFRKGAKYDRREGGHFLHGVSPVGMYTYGDKTFGYIDSASDVTSGGQAHTSLRVGRSYYSTGYGNAARNYLAVFNFTNVTIPNSATINSANLKITKGNTTTNSTAAEHYKIAGVVVDDGSIFHMPMGKGTSVAWSNLGAASTGTQLESPDIKNIIQEIVNLPAWRSGNGITLYMYYEQPTSTLSRSYFDIPTGYNSDGTTVANNSDGTTQVPELVIEHVGGTDTGTIVECDDTLQLRGVRTGNLTTTNDTFNNTGSYSTIKESNDVSQMSGLRGGFTVGVYDISLIGSDSITFASICLRFSNIQIAQGATVPTTKLSFYTFQDYKSEQPKVTDDDDIHYSGGVYYVTAHTLQSNHHALNGDGTNDAVGFRLRALNRDQVPNDLSTLGTTDFDHPQGLSNTGTSDMTTAYVDIPLSSIMTESTAYGAKGNTANVVTADISSVLQEVVNRSGWSSGNNIALFIYLPQNYSSASGSDNIRDNYAKQDIIKMTFIKPNIDSQTYYSDQVPIGMISTTRLSSTFNASTKKMLGREPKLIIG